jgi:tetratricopeptide (TPR) repeat protein
MRKASIIYLFFVIFVFFGFAEDLKGAENSLDKGIAEFKAENYEEALQFLTKAREQQPGSPMAAYYLGLTYKQMGVYRESAKHLIDAIRLTPPVEDAYPELVRVLYTQNKLNEAKDWISKAERQGIKPGPITFLKGLVLLKEGKNREAIEAFRKAKEVDPSLAQQSDFQIAVILTKQKKFNEAKESLKAVISVDPASEMASFAKEYEEAFTKEIKAYKPWQVMAGITYQYDDNVVLKPSTAIPGVLITGQRDSSVVTTFKFHYKPLLSDPWFFNAQYNVYANIHFSLHKSDLIYQTVSLTPGYQFQNGAITLPVSYSHVWLDKHQYTAVGFIKPTVSFMFLPNHIGQFSMEYARREMLKSPANRNRDEERDANIFILSPGYLYSFMGGKGMFNVRYEFSRDDTEGKNWENIGNRINLGLLLPLLSKLSFIFSGDICWQHYDHPHTFYGMERKDRTYYGSVGFLWEVFKGFSVNLQYAHTRADSNISVYEYKQNTYMIGAEYTF